MVQAQYCEVTGNQPSDWCPQDQIKTDWFLVGHEPRPETWFQQVQVVQVPFLTTSDGREVKKYVLWQEGCEGTPETLTLIKRPTTWVKHPTNPNNIWRYWPADWWKEVPTEYCTPVAGGGSGGAGSPGGNTGTPVESDSPRGGQNSDTGNAGGWMNWWTGSGTVPGGGINSGGNISPGNGTNSGGSISPGNGTNSGGTLLSRQRNQPGWQYLPRQPDQLGWGYLPRHRNQRGQQYLPRQPDQFGREHFPRRGEQLRHQSLPR